MSSGTTGAVHFPANKNAGASGIFLRRDQHRNEQRKFGYKTKKLRHPLRHTDEEEAFIQMEVVKEEDKKKFNKNNKDFIRTNKERFVPKDQNHHQPAPGSTQIKPGTVTLTQEQLAALLASLGKTAKDNTLKISIDASNNKIEVENYRAGDSGEDEEAYMNNNLERRDKSDKGIEALLSRARENGQNIPKQTAGTDSGGEFKPQKSQAKLSQNSFSSPDTPLQPHLLSQDGKQEPGVGNVSWMHLTVGERKRLQWARERAEVLDDYNPWGRPGAGAPMHQKEEEMKAHSSAQGVGSNGRVANVSRSGIDADRKQKQDLIVNEIERLQKEIREAERKKLKDEERVESALRESRPEDINDVNVNNREKNMPSQGRKTRTQNGMEVQMKAEQKTQSKPQEDDQDMVGLSSTTNVNKKEAERKRWLADLDKQRQEQRMKRQQDKERDREGINDEFVDRFVYHKTVEHISPKYEQSATHVTSHSTKDKGSVLGRAPENGIETVVPPAAMRSAMVVGAGTLNEARYDNSRSEERRRWLEELDRQREEQRLLKLAQKENDKQDAGIWADRYPADHQKLRQAYEILQNQSVSTRTNEPVSAQRINSAPHAVVQDSETSSATPPTFLRGQGVFIDPVTRKEHEEKRRIQLEYQAQVKAQIEEKERKKREERERKMQDDMEEERKLHMDRDVVNQQIEMEQRKIRAREEQRQKQLVALKSAMDVAEEKAVEDKNVKRIHDLQQRGHDVSQLRAAYEASAPYVKEYDMSLITGGGVESSRDNQTYMAAPALLSTYSIDTGMGRNDQNPLAELGNARPSYKKEPYIEDRILTPSSYRNPSKPEDVPNSPRRAFGTQTLELKDLQAILQNLPDDIQIEYKMKVEEALQEKEKRKQAPARKVHVKSAEDNADVCKDVNETQSKERFHKLENRPQWNQRQRKTVVKNSEKDPFYIHKKEEAEQRRERRERRLFYLQELNKEKIPLHSKSPGKGQGESPEEIKQTKERGRKVAVTSKNQDRKHIADSNRDVSPNILSLLSDGKKDISRSSLNTRTNSPPIPVIRHRTTAKTDSDRDPYQYVNNYLQTNQTDSKYGDAAVVPAGDEFVPFMRSTEILDPSKADEPVAISRENSRMERARNAYYETHHPANKGRKMDVYRDQERVISLKASQNPLLHPGLVTDHPTARQEMILQQLSSLKQTLKQRQRELEDYMSPSDLQEGAVCG